MLTSILPATGWDTFSVKSTSPAGVALTGQTSVPFEISSLSYGTEYAFTVGVQKTSGCDVGTTSDSTYNTHGCTREHMIYHTLKYFAGGKRVAILFNRRVS